MVELSENLKEKIEAGIYGFVLGDALGVPVEFCEREYLKKYPVKEMMGYGSHKVPEGTWSDDTSLTLAAMDSISKVQGIDYEDVMKRFNSWTTLAEYTATNELFDIGISTSKAIGNYKFGIPATSCGLDGIRDNGNGSLMRILPFVYYIYVNDLTEDEKVDIINSASSLTHAHEISRLGCKIYADYVMSLLDGVDKFEALNLLKLNDYSKYYSQETIDVYSRILKGDLGSLSEDEIKSSGYVVSSLEASIWCTLMNDTYESAVISAVNLGSDTDTVGAITGSINGIIHGMQALPERWLEKIKSKDYLDGITERFVNSLGYGKKK